MDAWPIHMYVYITNVSHMMTHSWPSRVTYVRVHIWEYIYVRVHIYENTYMTGLGHRMDGWMTQSYIYIYEWVIRIHTYVNESSNLWMSPVASMNESCHIYEWVMSHLRMSPVAYMTESCHMCILTYMYSHINVFSHMCHMCILTYVSHVYSLTYVSHVFSHICVFSHMCILT